ncbi:MAG: hypothetical protein NTX76_00110 [Alphaproteobacteria bacterium]|nr:hypothetical protein [Alphaproteobacteria bacterium]
MSFKKIWFLLSIAIVSLYLGLTIFDFVYKKYTEEEVKINISSPTDFKNDIDVQGFLKQANPQDHLVPEIKDLSILVPSCDKYSELWSPFFHFLFKNMPWLKTGSLRSSSIYLITGRKKINHERIVNIKIDEEKSWSDNMLKALDVIPTKYVLIVLDDYIIYENVSEKRFADLFNFMKETNAPYMELQKDPGRLEGGEIVSRPLSLTRKAQKGSYRASLQICIWEKDTLRRMLKSGESIWEFEISATKRTFDDTRPYLITHGDYVFRYHNLATKGKLCKIVVDFIRNDMDWDHTWKCTDEIPWGYGQYDLQ